MLGDRSLDDLIECELREQVRDVVREATRIGFVNAYVKAAPAAPTARAIEAEVSLAVDMALTLLEREWLGADDEYSYDDEQ